MIRAVLPAAGKGTRSGLNYPKTLQPVDGVPILVRLIRSLSPVVQGFTVIVSPDGRDAIASTLSAHRLDAELLTQETPLGMGDAVSKFASSAFFDATDEILLAWGDMLALPTELASTVVRRFRDETLDMAFPTHFKNPCYTHVMRDTDNSVTALLERREVGDALPRDGEADCGLFVFRKDPVFDILHGDRGALIGASTGEVGFLPVIGVLARKGFRVDAFPIARGIDAASFNAPEDLAEYAELSAADRDAPAC